MSLLLKPGGVVTMEFPHLLRLMQENQFDTIYHEHFSYFSFIVAERVFARARPDPVRRRGAPDARRFAAHLRAPCGERGPAGVERRWPGCARGSRRRASSAPDTYRAFAEQVRATKRSLLEFLIGAKEAGKRVVGYGAPAKGNTLLNYCGVRTDLLEYTVDRSPHKQGRFLPGVHIPIHAPERIMQDAAGLRPDPAVEPEGRDHRADGGHPRLGRPLRRADPRAEVLD